MSRFDRVLGTARSLAIYHAIPLRQRRMRQLYRQFVRRGDLVFDIGAHAGNRSRAFAALGSRVVAVEPQPDFARLLRLLLARTGRVEVVESAVGAVMGRASLAISERTPTVTTLAEGWKRDRAREPGFSGVVWNRTIEVDVTTLDHLIARFGVPAFTKIDVEGREPFVLEGLSQPLAALSFEYLPSALDEVRACVARLTALGRYEFNWSPGESYRLAEVRWLTAEEIMSALNQTDGSERSGDVYARSALVP